MAICPFDRKSAEVSFGFYVDGLVCGTLAHASF
jgi:hypothetical protein